MKSLVALLVWALVAGSLDATNLIMPEGKTLRYEYSVLINNEQSNDNIQRAIVGMVVDAEIHTVSAETAVVKFLDIKTAKVNDEVRELFVESDLLNFKSNPELQRELQIPFGVRYRAGEVVSMSFSNDDSEASKEIKKGFIQTLQFKAEPSQESRIEQIEREGSGEHRYTTYSPFDEPSRRYSGSYPSGYPKGYPSARGGYPSGAARNLVRALAKEGNNYYEVMEPSLSGVCQTQYSINRFPDESTGYTGVLNVTKIRDYRNCEESTYFVHSVLPTYKCSDCEADAQHPISKNTVVQMSLKAEGNSLLLENAESLSVIKICPFGDDADCFITEVNKTINLVAIKSGTERHPEMMERHARGGQEESLVSTITDKMEELIEQGGHDERDPILMPTLKKRPCQDKKINEYIAHISEAIVKDATKTEWKDVLDKVVLVVKELRMCSYDELKKISGYYLEHSKGDRAERRVFLDCLAQSGTISALHMWRSLTLDSAAPMSNSRSAQFIKQFSTHVLFPRVAILDQLIPVLQKFEAEHDEDTEHVFNTVAMQLGTLVSKACLRVKPYWKLASEPEKRCPEPRKYTKVLGDLLSQVSSNAKKVALIHALGETRLPSAIQYLEAFATGDITESDVVQTEAVFAVAKICKVHPGAARHLLNSVFMDQTNPTESRVAAFIGLTNAEMNSHDLEKYAMYTWQETDNTVGTFIIRYLDAIANSSHPCYAGLAPHALHSLQLANDDFSSNDPFTFAKIWDNDIDEVGINSLLVALGISDDHPLAPKLFYAKLKPNVAGVSPTLIKVAGQGTGIKSLLDQFVGPVSAFENKHKEAAEIFEKIDEDNKPVGLTNIAQKLGLKPREEDDTEGVIRLELLSTQHNMFYFNKRRLSKMAREYSGLSGKQDYKYERIMMPLETICVMPTSAGVPFFYKAAMPVIIGAAGTISAQGRSSYELNMGAVAAAKLIQISGVKLRITKKYVGTGYNTMALVKPNINAKLTIKENGVHFALSPSSYTPSKDNIIAYFCTRPFTFIYDYLSLEPIYKASKPITFLDEPREDEYPLMGYKLRNSPVVLKLKQDTFWNSRASVWDILARYADPSALPYAGATQSWKSRSYTLAWQKGYSPKNSEANLAINWDYKPSEAEPKLEKLLNKENPLRGLLTILAGWARPPQRCDPSGATYGAGYKHERVSTWQSYYDRQHERRQRLYSESEDEESDPWMKRFHQQQRFRDQSEYPHGGSRRYPSAFGDSEEEEYESRGSDSYAYPHKSYYEQRRQHRREQHPRQHGRVPYGQQQRDMSYGGQWAPSDRYQDVMYGGQHGVSGADTRSVKIGQGEQSLLTIDALLQLKGMDTTEYAGQLVLKRTIQKDEIVRTIELNAHAPSALKYKRVCAKAKIEVPLRPCYYGDQAIPIQAFHQKRIEGDLKVHWGQECANPSGSLEARLNIKKSEQQKKNDPQPEDFDRKPWFCKQCEEDRQDGAPFSDACMDAYKFYSEYHNVTLNMAYNNVPAPVQNLTIQSYLTFMYTYFPHLSFNPFVEDHRKGELTLRALYHYNNPAVDIKVLAPNHEAHYYKINYDDSYLIPYPPNVKESISRRIAESWTDGTPVGRGIISGTNVRTFDNQTYEVKNWANCPYVIAMDCSTSNMFAIVAKNVGSPNQAVTVQVLKQVIQLSPESGRPLTINGEQKDLPENTRVFVYSREQNKLVAYVEKHKAAVFVTLPLHGVQLRIIKDNVKVQVSPFWKNKVCGVLGDYDGDFIYEYKGPKGCAYEEGEDMANAYIIPDGSCASRIPSPKLCRLPTVNISSSAPSGPMGRQYHQASAEGYGCYMEKSLMTTHLNKICFSKRPVSKCQPGCRPAGEKVEHINFTCMERDDPKAEKLKADIQRERPIYGLSSKITHLSKSINVPAECVSQGSRYI